MCKDTDYHNKNIWFSYIPYVFYFIQLCFLVPGLYVAWFIKHFNVAFWINYKLSHIKDALYFLKTQTYLYLILKES